MAATRKPMNWKLWAKCLAAGAVISVGGPMLTVYVTPTEEEIFQRYNPDLQKRSLAERHIRQQEFDDFVCRLKAYSKSDKSIFVVMEEEEKLKKARALKNIQDAKTATAAQQEQMRREAGLSK